ncbi:Malate dehydrogenase 1, glyoxysomal [Glycine max]|nr:Malate dehydrogenase 1, glyoxysomal [Glycine max]
MYAPFNTSLPMVNPDDIVFGGWDITNINLAKHQLESALTGMDLVIILVAVPRKPRMTRDDLFKINVGIVRTLREGISKSFPNAIVNFISNPVNSTVAIAIEVFKKADTYDPKGLLGVTTVDVVRANTFVAGVCPAMFSSFKQRYLELNQERLMFQWLEVMLPCAFTDSYEKFKKAGAVVVGISGHDVASHNALASKYTLPFTLLSDEGNKVRKQ